MEFIPFNGQGGKLLLGHLDARSVGVRIQLGSNMETRIGRRAADQIDYHFKAEQRTTAPVMGDMAEHPMLDFVPLACSRGKVTNLDAQA